MNLLFYSAIDNQVSRKVLAIMQIHGEAFGLEFYRNITPLVRRLRQPAKELAMVVLFVNDMRDIDDMIAIRHFIDDIPVILILPNSSDEYIRKGHLLRPRFLTFAERVQKEIRVVLDNMLQKDRLSPMQDEFTGVNGTGGVRRI